MINDNIHLTRNEAVMLRMALNSWRVEGMPGVPKTATTDDIRSLINKLDHLEQRYVRQS